MWQSQRRCDFTNDVEINRYNQLETVLCDNVFSDTPVATTMADELNCSRRMVDQRGVLSLISSRYHCRRLSPSQISGIPPAGFESAQNLGSGFVE